MSTNTHYTIHVGPAHSLKPSLSDAAESSLKAEESQHRSEATLLALREAHEHQQQIGEALIQQYGVRGGDGAAIVGGPTGQQVIELGEIRASTNSGTKRQDTRDTSDGNTDREPTASLVRFHHGTDDEEESPEPVKMRRLPSVKSKHLRSNVSSVVDLSDIKDPDIRAFLDPTNDTVTTKDLMHWPPAKINELVDSIRPEHFPRLLNEAVKAGTQARAEALTFSRIHYKDAQGNVRLQDVSGYILPGEVCGLIAAPDAGASTLLDLLSGKLKINESGASLEGSILYNNQPPGTDYHQSVGFIDQHDMHLPLLTVEETLYFSARLRLPASIPDELVRLRVQIVMALLALSHVKDSLVGNEMVKGISGGQMRRLSVGVELTAGHSVLLADLPTNGLDSATAFELIRTFHHMVKAGLSMMCTVVQAGPELFSLFHRIIVMSKGSIIYSGPPTLAEPYFKSIGFIRPKAKSVPQFLEELSAAPESFYQPQLLSKQPSLLSAPSSTGDIAQSFKADSKWLPTAKSKKFFSKPTYSLHVKAPSNKTSTTTDVANLNQERVAAWNLLNESYSTSVFYCDVRETLIEMKKGDSDTDGKGRNDSPDSTGSQSDNSIGSSFLSKNWNDVYKSTYGVQLRENFTRQVKLHYRNRSSWLHIWMQSIFMGFMLGSLFYRDQLDETDIGIRSRYGLFFYLTALGSFGSFSILPVVLQQRSLFYNQTIHKFYHPTTYYLTFMSVQLFIIVVDLLLLLIPIWGLSGLAGFPLSGAFWFGFLCLLTCAITARHWILFICYLVPSEIIATTVLTISFYVFGLLSGEFIPEPVTVAGWRWAFNVSFVYWLFQALVLNDYVSADYVDANLGWTVGEDSKWTAWENGLYFLIAFGVAAVVTLTFLNWSRPPIPSVSDFTSKVDHKSKDEEEELVEAVTNTGAEGTAVTTASGKKKSSLPARAAYLEFHNLDYTVHLPNGTDRVLLKQVYGYAKPGRLVALMGKSGAGKSTLLDVLAGKKTGGVQRGPININGKEKEPVSFARYSAYVEQFDSHDPLSTVREAILFSGRLRLPRTLTTEQLNAKVDNVIDLLELRGVEHSIIGFPGRGGISMELRKKLTIAVEVIAEPALLFLDEPTTGLDSHSAANVMKTVRSLASSISVICTIHQPPSELVSYFQDVLLIEAGKVVYFGDIQQLPDFLHSVGAPKIAQGRNVSDYALEVISDRKLFKQDTSAPSEDGGNKGATDDIESGGKSQKGDLAELFLQSPYAAHVREFLDKGTNIKPDEQLSQTDLSAVNKGERASFWTQLIYLTRRFYNTSIRFRDSLLVRYIFAFAFGFIAGTVFTQLKMTQTDGQKRLSVVFFSVGHFLFSAMSFFPAIFMNRVLYFRESTNRLYTPLAYFLARILGDLPHILLEVFIPTIMIYFISDLNPYDHYKFYGFFFWANLIMRLSAIFFTQLVATVIAAPDFAYSVLATVMYLMFALTGFFIPYSYIPRWWRWLTNLDFLKFGLQFVALNEYRHQAWTCDPAGGDATVVISASDAASYGLCDNEPIQTFANPSDPSGATVLKCVYSCGYEFLDSLGVDTSTAWEIQSFVILHCFGLFFALCGYFALRFINHVKR